MNDLINFDGFSDVANNLINILSAAANWTVSRETLKQTAINTYVTEIKNSNYDPLTKAALINNAKKIIKEYSNQSSIVQKAITLLTEKSKPEEIEDDWLCEFMDKARLVSDEEFQNVWSKILAGEAERKNSFSIRTLNTVKNMNRKEAEIFSKVAKFALGDDNLRYIVNEKEINKKYGILLKDIIVLEDCGLMSAQPLSLTINVESQPNIFEDDGINIGVIESVNGCKESIVRSIYKFTESGKELLRVIEIEREELYLLDMLKEVKKENINNKNIKITAHKILNYAGDRVQFIKTDILTNDYIKQ